MKYTSELSDHELVMKLKNHDDAAMVLLYKTYWKILFSTAYKILQDKQACEDIIQDLFINIWNKRGEIEFRNSVHSYLLAAVRYEVFRVVKESKKFEPIIDQMVDNFSDNVYYDMIEYKELEQQINAAISNLPPKCRDVYMLSRNEKLSHKEISSQLFISTKTVRNHLTKALHHLRLHVEHSATLFIIIIFSRF